MKGLKKEKRESTALLGTRSDRHKFAITLTADRLSYGGDLTRATRLPRDDVANAGRDRRRGRTEEGVNSRVAVAAATCARGGKVERHELISGQGFMGTHGVKACVVLWRPLEDVSRLASSIRL